MTIEIKQIGEDSLAQYRRIPMTLRVELILRVEQAGGGLGSRLFERAAEWARGQGCRQMVIESQSNNVPGCRFYVARGCCLRSIDRYAYAHDPRRAHETQLIWCLDL